MDRVHWPSTLSIRCATTGTGTLNRMSSDYLPVSAATVDKQSAVVLFQEWATKSTNSRAAGTPGCWHIASTISAVRCRTGPVR